MKFDKIIKEIIVFSPVRIVTPFIGIISIYINTRFFSQEEYGLLNLITSTTTLINTFVFGWIGYVLVRYYHKYKLENNLPSFLSTVWAVVLGLCVITSIVLLAFSLFLIPDNYLLIILIVAQFPITVVNGYIFNLLQMESASKRYNIYGFISTIVSFLLFLLLISTTNLRTEAVLIPGLLVGLITLIIEGIRFHKLYTLNLKLFDNRIISEGLKYGLPQIGVSVSAVLLSIGDRYLIQYYYGEKAVGEYSAGYRIGEMLILLPTGIIASVVAPLIFKCYEEEGLEKAKKLVQNLYLFYIISLLPFVVLFSLRPGLFLILIGSNYANSINIIASVIIGSFIFGICQFTGMFLQILGKTMTIMFLIVTATIANIILNVILLKPLYIYGAALATLASYLLYFLLINYFSLNKVNLSFFNKRLFTIILIVAPMTVSLILCNFWVLSNAVTLSVFAFTFALYVFLILCIERNSLREFVREYQLSRSESIRNN